SGRHAVDPADRFAIHQDDSLIALADFRNIALDHHRLAIEDGEHLEKGIEVLVVWPQAEDARATIAVERFEDEIAMLGPKCANLFAIGRNQRRRHDILEIRDEKLLRRIADMK